MDALDFVVDSNTFVGHAVKASPRIRGCEENVGVGEFDSHVSHAAPRKARGRHSDSVKVGAFEGASAETNGNASCHIGGIRRRSPQADYPEVASGEYVEAVLSVKKPASGALQIGDVHSVKI